MKAIFGWKYFPLYFSILLVSQVSTVAAESMSISKFRELNPQSGEFTIWGYVVKHYTCPPCPPHLFCKPCMPNNILFSPHPKIQTDYPDGGSDLIIFTDHPEKLLLGRLYELTVSINTDESKGLPLRSVLLKRALEQSKNPGDT